MMENEEELNKKASEVKAVNWLLLHSSIDSLKESAARIRILQSQISKEDAEEYTSLYEYTLKSILKDIRKM